MQKVTCNAIQTWPNLDDLEVSEVDVQSVTMLLGTNVVDTELHQTFSTKFKHKKARSPRDAEETVKHCGDRYKVDLLWKDKNVELPKNCSWRRNV